MDERGWPASRSPARRPCQGFLRIRLRRRVLRPEIHGAAGRASRSKERAWSGRGARGDGISWSRGPSLSLEESSSSSGPICPLSARGIESASMGSRPSCACKRPECASEGEGEGQEDGYACDPRPRAQKAQLIEIRNTSLANRLATMKGPSLCSLPHNAARGVPSRTDRQMASFINELHASDGRPSACTQLAVRLASERGNAFAS
jgi:hypothetical protein